MAQCVATRRDGLRCTLVARGDGFCFAHSPALQEKRRAAYATGGTNKAAAKRLDRLTPATLRPLLEKFIDAVNRVEAGTLEPKQATAMAALGSVILKFYELGQLEATLADTQARLADLEKGRTA